MVNSERMSDRAIKARYDRLMKEGIVILPTVPFDEAAMGKAKSLEVEGEKPPEIKVSPPKLAEDMGKK